MTKYIFVTGGVVSWTGKRNYGGLSGTIIKSKGLKGELRRSWIRTIIRDIYISMLKWNHGSRIHMDVRIQLLRSYL